MDYQDHYLKALNPGTGELKPNLLSELRSYFNLSAADTELYDLCRAAPQAILEEWKGRKIDPSDHAAVTKFYVETNLYCYELISMEVEAPAYRQEQLVEFAKLLKGRKGLDYGSGIGSLGIYLNYHGIPCDFADVSETNLGFIRERLARRGLNGPRLINLLREEVPAGHYDFITAFDVLEHVPDPVEKLRELTSKLKEGGLFVFNLLGGEEDTPHILKDLNLVRKNLRGFGMRRLSAIGEFKVYKRVKRPPFVNPLFRMMDTLFWDFRESLRALKS